MTIVVFLFFVCFSSKIFFSWKKCFESLPIKKSHILIQAKSVYLIITLNIYT